MEKSKRKGKPNRRRWIIAIVLVLIGACFWLGFKIHYNINNPRYEAPIFADIDNVFSYELVENRLLEYMTFGESTCEEVKAFADEHLAPDEITSSCEFEETPHQLSYSVDRNVSFCNWYYLRITFVFENDVLSDIEYEDVPSCL